MPTITSARSNFRDAVTWRDAVDKKLVALANVQVFIVLPGTDPAVPANRVNVYGSRSPADVTPIPQPIVTDDTGIINFWAEPGEYDIFFHDLAGAPRISDQRIGWSPLSPVAKGIPTSKLRDDAALPIQSLGPDTMRQFAPLGAVIAWWRPSSAYDAGAGAGNPPPGYEVCDGRVVAAGSNDITPGVALTLPDLRNKFIIGADFLKADATASSNGDGTAAWNAAHPNAPGIRGVGGSNATHSHTIPGHYHGRGTLAISNAATGISISAVGDHTHTVGSVLVNDSSNHMAYGSSTVNVPADMSNVTPTTSAGGGHGHGMVDPSHGHATTGSVGNTAGSAGDSNMASTSTDGRPQHYGLLYIMKVRRA